MTARESKLPSFRAPRIEGWGTIATLAVAVLIPTVGLFVQFGEERSSREANREAIAELKAENKVQREMLVGIQVQLAKMEGRREGVKQLATELVKAMRHDGRGRSDNK